MTNTPQFGRLQPVDLRTAWEREDTHFTPWLAKPDNLALLGETIGIELELEAEEQRVGPFRADILCRDLDAPETFVLIENQIERTDHTHLGQLVTYAAGLDAVSIVWIAARFTEEHRAALDWLNEISHENVRFFGLEVELWRIGDSPVAPKFNMIAKPNDWSKAVRESRGAAANERREAYETFWGAFLQHLSEANSRLSHHRKPGIDHWMSWGIGRSGFKLSAIAGFRDGYVGAQLIVDCTDGAETYDSLKASVAAMDTDVDEPILWEFDPRRQQNYATFRRTGVDPKDPAQWPTLHRWMRERLELLDRVFRDRITEL